MGAIVAEWIGSSYGLGALIIEATYNFRSPLLYATVVIAATLAVVLFFVVSIAKRRSSAGSPPATNRPSIAQNLNTRVPMGRAPFTMPA